MLCDFSRGVRRRHRPCAHRHRGSATRGERPARGGGAADEIGLFVTYAFTSLGATCRGMRSRKMLLGLVLRAAAMASLAGIIMRAIRNSLTCLQRRAVKARSHRLRKRLRPTPGGRLGKSRPMTPPEPSCGPSASPSSLPHETPVRALRLTRTGQSQERFAISRRWAAWRRSGAVHAEDRKEEGWWMRSDT
jgi:hypothetical protein